MVLLRGAFFASLDVANGAGPRAQLSSGRETGGKVLGLVGFGGIGRLTAGLAHRLGMVVCAYDRALAPNAKTWRETDTRTLELDTIGRGSCEERGWKCVEESGGGG